LLELEGHAEVMTLEDHMEERTSVYHNKRTLGKNVMDFILVELVVDWSSERYMGRSEYFIDFCRLGYWPSV